MIVEGINVRETKTQFWISRPNKKVEAILDAEHKRVPHRLFWDKAPKEVPPSTSFDTPEL